MSSVIISKTINNINNDSSTSDLEVFQESENSQNIQNKKILSILKKPYNNENIIIRGDKKIEISKSHADLVYEIIKVRKNKYFKF